MIMTDKDRWWLTVIQTCLYDNGYMRFFENDVIDPHGNPMKRNLLQLKDWSVIVIPKSGDTLYLVWQNRYGTGEYSIEFPSGGVEEDEDALLAAQRELEEELGLESDSWTFVGEFHPANSLMPNRAYIFVADNVRKKRQLDHTPDAYERLTVEVFSIDNLDALIKKGGIKDSFTLTAYLRFKLAQVL